jgi:hypothetical protein
MVSVTHAVKIRPSFWFFMGVILSDLHQVFQTKPGENRGITSDAATIGQVCLTAVKRREKRPTLARKRADRWSPI